VDMDSDVEYHVYASFILIGKELDPQEITFALGISPDISFKRGDWRTETEKWRNGYWEICSENYVKSPGLSAHLEWITQKLIPVTTNIKEILKDSTIDAEISCFWILPPGQTVLSFSPILTRQLAELNVKIEIDMHSED